MRASLVHAPISHLLRPWRRRYRASSSSVAAFTTTSIDEDQSRGGLPRFYSRNLPPSKGSVVRIHDDEFWHMAKVLRLTVNDRVELFNGVGGLIEGCIQSIDKTGLDVMALEDLRVISPKKSQWHVFAAFGTLKGGRADWLVEKCTELGASSVTPILTERSPTITENRVDRLQRVTLAATKQCQRLHEMTLYRPLHFNDFLLKVRQSRLAFLATAGATPLIHVLSYRSLETGGHLIVGPEGELTLGSKERTNWHFFKISPRKR